MVLSLSDGAAVLVSSLVWAALGWSSGLWFTRQPTQKFVRDTRLTRLRDFERSGRFYERWFRIRRWKDRLPEQGALFEGGYSKAHLRDRSTANLERFVAETRRGEIAHWVNLGAGPVFLVWCPPGLGLAMITFGIVVHLPFVIIQRYNRARLQAFLGRRRARQDRISTVSA